MHITGVLVHTRPSDVAAIERRLQDLPGVEIHAVTELGRLVVTVEEHSERLMSDMVLKIHGLPGVLSAAMVYHYHAPELDDPIAQQEAAR